MDGGRVLDAIIGRQYDAAVSELGQMR